MAYQVGALLEGKVTGITKFGVFVALPEGGQSGMVHISEVAPTFVKEIRDYVQEGQQVKVKIISIDPTGKIALSMKRAQEGAAGTAAPQQSSRPPAAPHMRRSRPPARPAVFKGVPAEVDFRNRREDSLSFEDKMSKFKHDSDEKMSDLRKYMDHKRGSMGRKPGTAR